MLKRLTFKLAYHRHLHHLKPSTSAFVASRPVNFSIYPSYFRHFSTLKREDEDLDADTTDPYYQVAHDSSDDEEFTKILELNDLLASIHN